MEISKIIRAWKDADYRKSLNAEQLAALPANPAGETDLSEDELDKIVGGLSACMTTSGSCLASKRTEALACGGC